MLPSKCNQTIPTIINVIRRLPLHCTNSAAHRKHEESRVTFYISLQDSRLICETTAKKIRRQIFTFSPPLMPCGHLFISVFILCLNWSEWYICFCVGSNSCHYISIKAGQSNLELICEKTFNFGTEKPAFEGRSGSQAVSLREETDPGEPTHAAHVSSVAVACFKHRCCLSVLGRLPGEHFADNLGDPQRGGRERDNNQSERDPQLVLHGLRQLSYPVQKAKRVTRVGPPQPGQERTS